MHRHFAAYLSVAVITVLLSGITLVLYYRHADSTKDYRFTIVCTTTILADTVRSITGDHAQVISLMGPGIDPHVYRARESDLHKLLSADLIIYNGLHLEGKMADIFEHMPTVPTVAAAAGINASDLLESGEYPGIYDPHIWFDVQLWINVVEYVSRRVQEYDPPHASLYAHNTQSYLHTLHALDAWVMDHIMNIPQHQRILITAHDAFGYFGRRYDIRVVGLQGISTDSEPGITDIQELARIIVQHQIPSLFIEASVPTRALHAVQAAVAAQGFAVNVGEELYSDTLGIEGSNADTYSSMVRYNVQAIVNGLH